MKISVDSQDTLGMLTSVCDAARQMDFPRDILRGLNVTKMAMMILENSGVEPPKKETPKKESPDGEN